MPKSSNEKKRGYPRPQWSTVGEMKVVRRTTKHFSSDLSVQIVCTAQSEETARGTQLRSQTAQNRCSVKALHASSPSRVPSLPSLHVPFVQQLTKRPPEIHQRTTVCAGAVVKKQTSQPVKPGANQLPSGAEVINQASEPATYALRRVAAVKERYTARREREKVQTLRLAVVPLSAGLVDTHVLPACSPSCLRVLAPDSFALNALACSSTSCFFALRPCLQFFIGLSQLWCLFPRTSAHTVHWYRYPSVRRIPKRLDSEPPHFGP